MTWLLLPPNTHWTPISRLHKSRGFVHTVRFDWVTELHPGCWLVNSKNWAGLHGCDFRCMLLDRPSVTIDGSPSSQVNTIFVLISVHLMTRSLWLFSWDHCHAFDGSLCCSFGELPLVEQLSIQQRQSALSSLGSCGGQREENNKHAE